MENVQNHMWRMKYVYSWEGHQRKALPHSLLSNVSMSREGSTTHSLPASISPLKPLECQRVCFWKRCSVKNAVNQNTMPWKNFTPAAIAHGWKSLFPNIAVGGATRDSRRSVFRANARLFRRRFLNKLFNKFFSWLNQDMTQKEEALKECEVTKPRREPGFKQERLPPSLRDLNLGWRCFRGCLQRQSRSL